MRAGRDGSEPGSTRTEIDHGTGQAGAAGRIERDAGAMGDNILGRIWNLVMANVNALIDGAEDP